MRPVVPIHRGRGRPAHLQFAEFAGLDRGAVVADEADIIARHRLAGGAVAHVAAAVRQENVQHLGRAEPVEDVDAVTPTPAPRHIGRQRFPGRYAGAQTQFRPRRRGSARQEGRVEGRHPEQRRDGVPAQQVGYRLRRRAPRHQDGGGARRQRKRHGIAEAIGEKQFCHRIDQVVLGQPQYGRGIKFGRQARACLHMHRALGLAGGAGGVEPEAQVVARCRRGDVIARCTGQQVFEQRKAVSLAVASGDRNDDVLEVRA